MEEMASPVNADIDKRRSVRILPGSVSFMGDYDEIRKHIHHQFTLAQRVIYYSAWLLFADQELVPGVTFREAVRAACARGVKVFLLLFKNALYPNSPVYTKQDFFDSSSCPGTDNLDVQYVDIRGHISPVFRAVVRLVTKFKQLGKWGHHQKYMLVDGCGMTLNGTDLADNRKGSVTLGIPNAQGYIWYESSIYFRFPIEPEFGASPIECFCATNHETGGREIDTGIEELDTHGEQQEYTTILEIIRSTKYMLYLENQYVVSHAKTTNLVAEAILQALEVQPKLQVYIITNKVFHDTDSAALQMTLQAETYATLYYLMEEGHKRHITAYKDRIHFGYLERIFVHSKLIVSDDDVIHYSTANIADRSFGSDGKCDAELSVTIKSKSVVARWRTFHEKNFKHVQFVEMRQQDTIASEIGHRVMGAVNQLLVNTLYSKERLV